jgi:hypothetical protein
MKVTNLVALLAALLLTVAEFLVFEYDARQNVVLYQAEAASALAVARVVCHGAGWRLGRRSGVQPAPAALSR